LQPLPSQITKLAHRVSLLKEQTFLIIHATADGKLAHHLSSLYIWDGFDFS